MTGSNLERLGRERPASLPLLLLVLTVTTGLIDAVSVVGLGADSSFAGGDNPRFARRVASVAAMLAGAVAGGMLVLAVGVAWPLAVSGAITLLATLIYVARVAPPSARRP